MTKFLCIQIALWITKLISFEAGFHYHSTQPTFANATSAYILFSAIGKNLMTDG
jgi:hypothetical protein